MKSQRLSHEEFKSIYSKVPRLCVEIILETDEGILLTLRNLPTWRGFWHIPGGTVLYQEPILDAVKRVAKEELGIDVTIEKFVTYLEYSPEEEGRERGYGHTISLFFLCHPLSNDIHISQEASDAKFFKDWPTPMIAAQKTLLDDYLKTKA